MPLQEARSGQPLKVRGWQVPFSFWPMTRTTRRYGLQFRIFASDPWPIMVRSVRKRCPTAARPAATAFLAQARDYYYSAGSGGVVAAKPVLLYYSFLNLAKAYILTCGQRQQLDEAQHGLSEQLAVNGQELVDAYLHAYRSTGSTINIFDEFLKAVSGAKLARDKMRFDMVKILPQILMGHRLWAQAAGEKERFISVHRPAFLSNPTDKTIWLNCYVFEDDLTRLGVSHQRLLEEAGLEADWREVRCHEEIGGRRLLCFEQKATVHYSHRPADEVPALAETVRDKLWAAITLHPPYRRYYLYLTPKGEKDCLLPQVASTYACMYYLGSITRYRPHYFDKLLTDKYGPMIEGTLNDQPTQFIFTMASRFAKQEVTRASIA